MKITIVMGFFLPVPAVAGGATEKIWHQLGALMAEEGHDVTIISRQWPGLAAREQVGRLTHLRLRGMDHTRSLPANLLLDLVWGFRVAKQLPPADVVVCNTVSLPIYLRRLRSDAGRVAVVLGRMPKGQTRFYSAADLLLATSAAVAEKARRENARLAERITIFPNPIDWHLHASAATQRPAGSPLIIGYIGRIHPEKGLETMLEAACRLLPRQDLPSWRITLIGPVSVAHGGGGESYRETLQQRFGGRLGARLSFVPPVFDRAALARHYGELGVFCYPSVAARGEGLSIAPLEAMAAGAVPVVSKLDCYRDVIVPGENGLQFDHERPDAAEQLAQHFAALLGNETYRRELATRAQSSVRRFDYRETARLLLARFAQLTGRERIQTVNA